MNHNFNVYIAKLYGVHAAVLLNNLEHWIAKNKANGKHFYDGNYWTYNSKRAFSELFPYMTSRQIDYALKKLIDDGVIVSGNYNQIAYDRTLWYAITEKGYSILQNCEMEKRNLQNGGNENVQPIPDINTNINTNIKENKKEREEIEHPIEKKLNTSNEKKQDVENMGVVKKGKGSFDTLIDEYCKTVDPLKADEIKGLLQDWLKVRKAKRAALTDKAIELNLKKLNEYAKESNMTVETYLEEVIMRGWQAFYPIKEYGAGAGKQGEKKTVSNNPFLEIAKERGLL